MLDTLKQLGVTPDFVVYHRYEQGPGGESDLFLLNSAASWANDAAALRQMLDDYLGPKARRVELACHRTQFGVQQSGQADHQPRQRPVLRRRHRQPVEDRIQRDVVVGSAQRPGRQATTTARRCTAGAATATTASSMPPIPRAPPTATRRST